MSDGVKTGFSFGQFEINIDRRPSLKSGEAVNMEGLPEERLYNFAWSKDGKWFSYFRGQEIRDVVLIENTSK